MACSPGPAEEVDFGTGYSFKYGYPEVRLSAIGLYNDKGEPGINVSADIVYGSLTFFKRATDKELHADLKFNIEIWSLETGFMVNSENHTIQVNTSETKHADSQEVLSISKRLEADPGDYKVTVSVIDMKSGKETVQSTKVFIPDAEDDEPRITAIQILARDKKNTDKGFFPVPTYDIPGRMDSLKIRYQVTNSENDTLILRNQLFYIPADTSLARSLSVRNVPSRLNDHGIYYREKEIVQSNRRVITQEGSILIEIDLPMLDQGNYRFQAEMERSSYSKKTKKFRTRDFGIKSANYPTVKTPKELAAPLAYLMDEEAYIKLMKINDSDSLKKAVDHFWLSNIKNKRIAKTVVSRYYELVEMANKQFTTYKEGWKTDPGKIYILFGPPMFVESNVNSMLWLYSYNREDPDRTFLFRQVGLHNQGLPTENWLLMRRDRYFTLEYQRIQDWLNGRAINRGL